MLSQLFRLASPAGANGRLSVLIFHRVLTAPDSLFPGEMYAARFDQVCTWLKTWFNVLPLDAAVSAMKTASLPARAASITFDDGYADNYRVALPILQRHGLTATFFIATGFLDGGRMWNDTIVETVRTCVTSELDLSSLNLGRHPVESIQNRRAAIAAIIDAAKYLPVEERNHVAERIAKFAQQPLSQNLMLASGEVQAMERAGMQIGAHTVSHPILATLTDANARQEILTSKTYLEHLIGRRVGLFAYPNGKVGKDYSQKNVTLVRDLGFDAAFSTESGASSVEADFFQIQRFTPWDQTKLRFGLRLLANLRNNSNS